MLNKTEKGRQELVPGQRRLGQRERAVLLVADGSKATASLAALFGGEGRAILDALIAGGYLIEETPAAAAASPAASRVAASSAAPARGSADAFSGPRSLASARMFLFDMSERTFSPRDKALAERFRNALREARDVPSMMETARAMLAEIEQLAGPERVDAISERLARLLPESVLDNA